jgi:hypothetical protein
VQMAASRKPISVMPGRLAGAKAAAQQQRRQRRRKTEAIQPVGQRTKNGRRNQEKIGGRAFGRPPRRPVI